MTMKSKLFKIKKYKAISDLTDKATQEIDKAIETKDIGHLLSAMSLIMQMKCIVAQKYNGNN